MNHSKIIIDGNEAAAHIAHKLSEVCAIYPITPSSTMGELADQWSSQGRKNLWGAVPEVIEMQSEGGAAGAVHGALQTGALTTTFTASQGLLLMIPNMFKIAGELTSTVFHVAARSLACQGLSIFGDHSDVMAARMTGWAMLSSGSVQESHDLALVAHAATLEARLPFIHFFDGFRTSHEVQKIDLLTDDLIRKMIRDDLVRDHRARGLNPDHPVMRGTAQNPDVYFQGRESVNRFYTAAPDITQKYMDLLGQLTGRAYKVYEYHGPPDAERVMIIMGSGAETARETASFLAAKGEKVGVLQVRLFRPFSVKHFLAALPRSVRSIAVLDRTKEPGGAGEPLYQDVLTAIAEADALGIPMSGRLKIVGGRYGLSSKEFTPAMCIRVFDELAKPDPKNHFTIGIHDDVTHSSLDYDPTRLLPAHNVSRCIFYGLGADGTVGANKNTIKIIGEETDSYTQGYFVYDSKKSGSRTISHLRFGPDPIRAAYLIQNAGFIGCHQFQFVFQIDVLERASQGAVFLLNSPYPSDEVWDRLPRRMQGQIIDKKLKFFVIDAYEVARATGMGTRTNTIMQTCFFAISGVLPREEAIAKIKTSVKKTYGSKGEEVIRKNFEAIDHTLTHLKEVSVPVRPTSTIELPPAVPAHAPAFVRNVTGMIMSERGDALPVSAMPVDGTYPTGTASWEKRNISLFVPAWEPDLCIQCGNCAFVCPHSCIRAKFYSKDVLENAPDGFRTARLRGRGFPDQRYTLQVYVEDCTGCSLCVDVCPAKSKEKTGFRAINMTEKAPLLERERINTGFFEQIPDNDRARVDFSKVRGVQYLQPLFEFSGACSGCGETPYLKVLTQLFGDRMLVANATGCSSIYGGNLPTTPWSQNKAGRGPAWSNSLFEDNAEFGLGYRLTADKHLEMARGMLQAQAGRIGQELVGQLLEASQRTEGEIIAQRERVDRLKLILESFRDDDARNLLSLADQLVRRSVWIVGGDGWAYDIGYGGLDHVLASGRDVNILVLDTEVYSNTGGQASKSTPMGAVAKFAAGGKPIGKKDLAMMAVAYGNVYVARIAMGASAQQTVLAMREAEAYPGPSLILAYSHCIAHGINMEQGLHQQERAVDSGHWPLFRYNPSLKEVGLNPMEMDSPRPSISLKDYAYREIRYKMLVNSNPERAEMLMNLAEGELEKKWSLYEYLANREGPNGNGKAGAGDSAPGNGKT